MDTFPQPQPPSLGSGLLATDRGRYIWFQTEDDDTGVATLRRITPGGDASGLATVEGGNILVPPVEAADRSVWVTGNTGGEGLTGTGGLALAGVDPDTLQVTTAVAPGTELLGGHDVAAGRSGRVWAQGNTDEGVILVGAGQDVPLASVQTQIQAASATDDEFVSNPLALGPGGVWLLGPGPLGGLRMALVGADGIVADVAPGAFRVAALALAPGRTRMWTVAIERGVGTLAAFGVAPDGGTRAVRTSLRAECSQAAAQPVADRRDRVWFTGSTAECGSSGQPPGELVVAEAFGRRGTVDEHETGLAPLGEISGLGVSSVLPRGGGAVVAGLGDGGDLALARVGIRTRTFETSVQPWLAPGQARYPLVGDRRGGVWGQGVDNDSNLVVVRVGRLRMRTATTDVTPIAREFAVGPDGNLWTQGSSAGELVLVRVTPRGRVTTFPTGVAPTQTVVAPVADRRGHVWFRALDPDSGTLVLVRVRATGDRGIVGTK